MLINVDEFQPAFITGKCMVEIYPTKEFLKKMELYFYGTMTLLYTINWVCIEIAWIMKKIHAISAYHSCVSKFKGRNQFSYFLFGQESYAPQRYFSKMYSREIHLLGCFSVIEWRVIRVKGHQLRCKIIFLEYARKLMRGVLIQDKSKYFPCGKK